MVLRFLDGDRSDCFFVIFGPNGDFDKEIMKGKRRFGARFGFAFLWGGGVQPRFRFAGGGQPWRRWAHRGRKEDLQTKVVGTKVVGKK